MIPAQSSASVWYKVSATWHRRLRGITIVVVTLWLFSIFHLVLQQNLMWIRVSCSFSHTLIGWDLSDTKRKKIVELLAFSKISISFWETELQSFEAGYAFYFDTQARFYIEEVLYQNEVIQKVLIAVKIGFINQTDKTAIGHTQTIPLLHNFFKNQKTTFRKDFWNLYPGHSGI